MHWHSDPLTTDITVSPSSFTPQLSFTPQPRRAPSTHTIDSTRPHRAAQGIRCRNVRVRQVRASSRGTTQLRVAEDPAHRGSNPRSRRLMRQLISKLQSCTAADEPAVAGLEGGRRDAGDGAMLLLRVLLSHSLQVVGSSILVQRVDVTHTRQDGGLRVARVLRQLGRLRYDESNDRAGQAVRWRQPAQPDSVRQTGCGKRTHGCEPIVLRAR